MIDVILVGGVILSGVTIPFRVMRCLLDDGVIADDGFVDLPFEDGAHGAVKKKQHHRVLRSDRHAGITCVLFFFAFPVPQAEKNGTSPDTTGTTSEDERSKKA